MSDAINVLIVDDSAFARSVIAKKLGIDSGIAVAGFARDGADALEKIRALKPDVVTMDITMPEMDGLTALKHIMAGNPLPVIMVSALTGPQTQATITALELGAVDFFLKPSVANPAGVGAGAEELIQKIKTAAAVSGKRLVPSSRKKRPRRLEPSQTIGAIPDMVNVLVIGASTGGPKALAELIPESPPNLPTGILIVQHIGLRCFGKNTSIEARCGDYGHHHARDGRANRAETHHGRQSLTSDHGQRSDRSANPGNHHGIGAGGGGLFP